MIREIVNQWYWQHEYYILLSFVAYSTVIGYFIAFSEEYLCSAAENWMRASSLMGGITIVVSVISVVIGPIVSIAVWGAVGGSLRFAAMLLVGLAILGPWAKRSPIPVYLNVPFGGASLCVMASHYFNPPYLPF